MPTLPKPAAKRQRSRREIGPDPAPVTSPGVAPTMPRGLCRQARTAWSDYYSDIVSGALRESDTTVVLRWCRNLDRYYKLLETADATPQVTGSKGQTATNPLYVLAYKIEASIRDDEKQLGVGPYNRLRLGLALSEGASSLAALNAEADVDDGAGDDDPRVVLLADRRGDR